MDMTTIINAPTGTREDQGLTPMQPTDPLALTLEEYARWRDEIEMQPPWRANADKEMDYADGNQLDSELLRRQKELGIPPAVENEIGPALLSVQGYEVSTRTDWRVTPNGDPGGQDVADALNYKLNQAERESHADAACTQAFRPQAAVGMGWVEVSRDGNPFHYPYRCRYVHRGEIWWDWQAQERDLSDARYLIRQRWLDPDRIARVFPERAGDIRVLGRDASQSYLALTPGNMEGGGSTGLLSGWASARGWTTTEDRWYNPDNRQLCLAEIWYRRWVDVAVLTAPDGRVVEFDETNMAHVYALSTGMAKVTRTVVPKVRRSYWLGPMCLYDGPTPYSHSHFPYVPFWGYREDITRAPFGMVRDMVFAQDSLNSGISKLRWGLSAVRVERTKGAVEMSDAQFRKMVGRVDADVLLNADHMSKPGARFEVKRDYTLTEQHFKMLEDNRATIQRVSAATAAFMGRNGSATSGLQEQTQVEQSNQSLATLMDNFRAGRSQVGELLLSMIVDDLGSQPATIVIEGDAVHADRAVIINKPELDPETNTPYLSNDLQRTRLKVVLEDVPSSSSYRSQQLNAMSEAVKSLPAEYQAVVLPFMVQLMDVPFKRDVVEAIRAVSQQQTPEQIEQTIKERVQQELIKAGHDLKERELDLKAQLTQAQIKQVLAQAVQTGVQAAFAAMQGGAQIATMPMVAPIADKIMQSAGYQPPTPGGVDPNYPTPATAAAVNMPAPYIQGQGAAAAGQEAAQAAAEGTEPAVHRNTSPTFPPRAGDGMRGIETARTSDNA